MKTRRSAIHSGIIRCAWAGSLAAFAGFLGACATTDGPPPTIMFTPEKGSARLVLRPGVTIWANDLKVSRAPDGGIAGVKATGSVSLQVEPGGRYFALAARSGRAEFDADTGAIVLKDWPAITYDNSVSMSRSADGVVILKPGKRILFKGPHFTELTLSG